MTYDVTFVVAVKSKDGTVNDYECDFPVEASTPLEAAFRVGLAMQALAAACPLPEQSPDSSKEEDKESKR